MIKKHVPSRTTTPLGAIVPTMTPVPRGESDIARRDLVTALLGVVGAGAAASTLSACFSDLEESPSRPEKLGQALDPLTTSLLYFTSVGTLGGSSSTLKGTPGGGSNQIAILEGYATPGDGGGGLFYWSTATTLTEDLGTVFAARASDAGAVDGYWVRIYSGPLNVRWFGARGDELNDDTSAIQKAYDVAWTLKSATVYFPAGNYKISSTVTIGQTGFPVNYSSISTIGEGYATTIIKWVPPTPAGATGTAIRYYHNKYARMVGIQVQNGVKAGDAYTTGTTIGLLLSGESGGTQSNGLIFENCAWTGFNVGLQAGGGQSDYTDAASEIVLINCAFSNCVSGFYAEGTGNSLNFWFYGCSFSFNTRGADLKGAGSVHFWGGASKSNSVAAIAPSTGGWQTTLRVEGFRFELAPPEMAIGGSSSRVIVENCIFLSGSVPTYPVIGASKMVSIRGCAFGSSGQTGWLAYNPGESASSTALEMVGNLIYGTVPFFISTTNGGSNGMKYSLFGNEYNGAMQGSEVGRIVWPNRVNDVVSGSATFASSNTVTVSFPARENNSYKVTLAGISEGQETFWIDRYNGQLSTSGAPPKSTTGFTLKSSNATSTATVDWVVSR